jgi:hypothetical protein
MPREKPKGKLKNVLEAKKKKTTKKRELQHKIYEIQQK